MEWKDLKPRINGMGYCKQVAEEAVTLPKQSNSFRVCLIGNNIMGPESSAKVKEIANTERQPVSKTLWYENYTNLVNDVLQMDCEDTAPPLVRIMTILNDCNTSVVTYLNWRSVTKDTLSAEKHMEDLV